MGSTSEKYNTLAAEYYRNMMKAKESGSQLPPLPAPGTGKNLTNGCSAQPKVMGGFGSGGPSQNSAQNSGGPNRDFGLSYQGGNNNNPYSYNNGTGGRSDSGNDLFANVSGFLQSAVVAGNQFAEQAGNKLNEAKTQAQNDGWFDFDNLQAQASAFADQAKQKAQELAGGNSPPPGQRSGGGTRASAAKILQNQSILKVSVGIFKMKGIKIQILPRRS